MYNERKETFSVRDVVLQLLFVLLFVFILLWLFPTKKFVTDSVKPFYETRFNENVNAMKDAAQSYFTNSRLPKKVGDKVALTLGEMLDKKIILPFLDSNNKQCDLNDSYVEITKMDDEYILKVNLDCTDKTDYVLVYMGCYNYCETDICEKKEEETVKPTVNKPSTPTTPTVNKPTTPVVNNYKYVKQITDVKYEWTSWSNYIEYSDKDNIKSGCTTDKCIETKIETKKTGTKNIVLESKVSYTNILGSYKQKVCTDFNYYRVTFSGGTTKTFTTSGEVDMGVSAYSSAPTDNDTYRYEYVGTDYSRCNQTCSGYPYLLFRKIKRGTVTTTSDGAVTSIINVTCANVQVKEIVVYGMKREDIIGTVDIFKDVNTYRYKTRIEKVNKYSDTKWSTNPNDKNLLNQGYVRA